MAEFRDIFEGGADLEGAELEDALDEAYGIRSRSETVPITHKGRSSTDLASSVLAAADVEAGFCDVAHGEW